VPDDVDELVDVHLLVRHAGSLVMLAIIANVAPGFQRHQE
jgi:hypothetical protein